MKQEKETREKLLKSAKAEFLEKGYMKASLRNICKNAGVTTGALYFFFKDKEDLFASLVEEPLQKLHVLMEIHYKDEREAADEEVIKHEDFSEDLEVAKQIVHFIYQYYDEFQLILLKSQGSGMENSFNRFAEISEEHYRKLSDRYTELTGGKRVDDYTIHWIACMQIEMFVHMLRHELSEEAAVSYIGTMVKFMIAGWFGMMQ